MPHADLLTTLTQQPLLCDGAMGTQLMARGLPAGVCGESWNLEQPDVVAAIHGAYRQAGCDLLTTNSFGGTRCNLEKHGLGEQVDAINAAAAQMARRAAGDSAWVLGDVGPFGGFLEPMGEMTEPELLDIFAEQIQALYRGGADAVIIETMGDPGEAAVAVRAAKSVKPAPVIATFAFNRAADGTFRTMMGATVQQALTTAIEAGAGVVGANCGTSLALVDYLELAERLVKAAGKTPVILQPNAGSPEMVGGKMVHPATPADMAAIVQPLLSSGVRIVGGCCGTTPEHLRAMGGAMNATR